MRYQTGLVIGKFYPPHTGHHYLIDFAKSHCDHLTVLLCVLPAESPDGATRAHWLQEIHPNVSVRAIPSLPPAHDYDSQMWARYTVQTLGYAPDAVFTSEPYGEPYARFLSEEANTPCVHIAVDPQRRLFPVSGTATRAEPLTYWNDLSPAMRAFYAPRICVLGAESTGTTTMSRLLAQHYRTVWVPEYGREFSERKVITGVEEWRTEEFYHIARTQIAREDEAARRANRILICDTDAFTTSVFHQMYLGGVRAAAVEELARTRTYALTFVTAPDGVPYVQDGTRKPEAWRAEMHRLFVEGLQAWERPFVVLHGSLVERLATATTAIDRLLPTEPLAGIDSGDYGPEIETYTEERAR